MAWQEGAASAAQIAAKAAKKPTGRNLAAKAVQQRLGPHRSLAGVLGGLAPFFKRRITAHWRLPRFTKVERNSESRLMIADNLAGVRLAVPADNTARKQGRRH
jgi:hypothetical protein